jgi:hypothetical protein
MNLVNEVTFRKGERRRREKRWATIVALKSCRFRHSAPKVRLAIAQKSAERNTHANQHKVVTKEIIPNLQMFDLQIYLQSRAADPPPSLLVGLMSPVVFYARRLTCKTEKFPCEAPHESM